MPAFGAVGLPRSVRTCFACGRRRFPPAFVAWHFDEGDAVYALCEGCLARPDREDWARRFLRESGAEYPHYFFFIAGEGTDSAAVFAPLIPEAFERGKVITRNLRGLPDSRKTFWRRVRSGPAPRGWIEMGSRPGQVEWSESVWDTEQGK